MQGRLPSVPAIHITLTPKTMKRRNRQSIRLKRYQYDKPGAYFITINAYRKRHLFGRIIYGEMHLNNIGQIVYDEWYRSRDIRPNITLDEFIIMPNHIHGIIIFHDSDNTGGYPPERAHSSAPRHEARPTSEPKHGPPPERAHSHNAASTPESQPERAHSRARRHDANPTSEPKHRDAPLHRPPQSLGSFIAGFKSAATKRINILRGTPGTPVWHRNYHDQIIWNQRALKRIRRYIRYNPMNWKGR